MAPPPGGSTAMSPRNSPFFAGLFAAVILACLRKAPRVECPAFDKLFSHVVVDSVTTASHVTVHTSPYRGRLAAAPTPSPPPKGYRGLVPPPPPPGSIRMAVHHRRRGCPPPKTCFNFHSGRGGTPPPLDPLPPSPPPPPAQVHPKTWVLGTCFSHGKEFFGAFGACHTLCTYCSM